MSRKLECSSINFHSDRFMQAVGEWESWHVLAEGGFERGIAFADCACCPLKNANPELEGVSCSGIDGSGTAVISGYPENIGKGECEIVYVAEEKA